MKGVILAPLGTVHEGQEFTAYPPHITLVPPFQMDDANVGALCNNLREVAEDWLPLRCFATDIERFGDQGEIAVRKIAGILFGNHAGALVSVRRYGGIFDDTYTGVDGWAPHVSAHEALQDGDRFMIDNFVLMSSTRGVKKVVAKFSR